MSLKDAKINFLVDTATDLFMARSVNEVTIKDIASAAQVGEATLYRYFSNKQNIVIHAALKMQVLVNKDYFKLEKGKTGYEKLAIFYESYLQIFAKHPNYYKFLSEFDAYMANDHSDDINRYENAINAYKNHYIDAYYLGLKDGSIKEQEDIEMLYFATTHALLELCKKLSNKAVLNQDLRIEKTSEIQCLINIVLNKIRIG